MSTTKRKTATAGTKKKPSVKQAKYEEIHRDRNPSCEYPEWSLDSVMKFIAEETSSTNETELTQKQKPPAKKAAPAKAKKTGKEDVMSPVEIKNFFQNDVPADISAIVPSFSEWKVKERFKLLRKKSPPHPFFSKDTAFYQSFQNNTEEGKKKVETKPPPKSRNQKGGTPNPSAGDALILQLKKEVEEDLIREYGVYADFSKVVSKGAWCECFISCLNLINFYRHVIPVGDYLWELIWPKHRKNEHIPKRSTFGKYIVKLFIQGSYRAVIVDSKFPYDADNNMLLPETERGEMWPAILYKALYRVAPRKDMLVNSPVFILHALCGNYISSPYSPRSSLLCLRQIRDTLQHISERHSPDSVVRHYVSTLSEAKSGEKPNPALTAGFTEASNVNQLHKTPLKFMYATCFRENDLSTEVQAAFVASGLDSKKLYIIVDTRVYRGETLLRLLSNDITWKGQYSYFDGNCWTAEFEDEFGFCMQDRLVGSRYTDFWISFTDFSHFFKYVHVMTDTRSLPHKVSLFAEQLRSSYSIYVNNDTSVYVKLYSLPNLADLQRSSQLGFTVYLYDWKQPKPYTLIQELKHDVDNEFIYSLYAAHPSTEESNAKSEGVLLNVNFLGIEATKNVVIELMSAQEISGIGSLDELLEYKLGVTTASSEPENFPAHSADEWKVWFVKELAVTAPTSFCMELCNVDPQILSMMDLSIINNKTGEMSKAIAGKFVPTTLQANDNSGYTLIAHLKAKRETAAGALTLKVMADTNILDALESYTLYPLQMAGKYTPNKENELLKYIVWAGERSIGCLYFTISDDIPFTLKVESKTGARDSEPGQVVFEETVVNKRFVLVPSVVLLPSEKTKAKFYIVTATISPYHAKQYFDTRMQKVEEVYNNIMQQLLAQPPEETQIPERPSSKSSKKPAKLVAAKTTAVSKITTATKKAPVKPTPQQAKKTPGPRIPVKQEKPVLEEGPEEQTADTTIPFLTNIPVSKLVDSEEFPSFNILAYFTSPNIIVEKVNKKKEKVETLLLEWEKTQPGRVLEARQAREQFFRERTSETLKSQGPLTPQTPLTNGEEHRRNSIATTTASLPVIKPKTRPASTLDFATDAPLWIQRASPWPTRFMTDFEDRPQSAGSATSGLNDSFSSVGSSPFFRRERLQRATPDPTNLLKERDAQEKRMITPVDLEERKKKLAQDLEFAKTEMEAERKKREEAIRAQTDYATETDGNLSLFVKNMNSQIIEEKRKRIAFMEEKMRKIQEQLEAEEKRKQAEEKAKKEASSKKK